MTGGGRAPVLTGGCQCGAVRYALYSRPRSTLCHCRMCQRAVGNLFAALCMVPKTDLEWTRGSPKLFASSNVAERGFCAACGTPLTFAFRERDRMEVTTGSLDDPSAVPMVEHFGVESRVPWLALCDGLPERATDANGDSPALAPGFRSHQAAP